MGDDLLEFYQTLNEVQLSRENENRERWRKAKSSDYPCANVKLVKEKKGMVLGWLKCKLTDRGCVCSYYSQSLMGSMMNQNYKNCPGFKKRKKKDKGDV